MKTVKVEILNVVANEQVGATIFVEKKKGETWNRVKIHDVVSGTPEANRQFLLEDDERLVIEGSSKTVMVYDRDQNASKIVDADPNVREAQAKAEAAQLEANKLREAKTGEVKPRLDELARQNQPRTNIGNPRPEASRPLDMGPTPGAPKVLGDTGQGVVGTKPSGMVESKK